MEGEGGGREGRRTREGGRQREGDGDMNTGYTFEYPWHPAQDPCASMSATSA
jgi:hypothetical protein